MKRMIQRTAHKKKDISHNKRGLFALPFLQRIRAFFNARSLAFFLALLMALQLTGTDWIVWAAGQLSSIARAAEFTPPPLPGCTDGSGVAASYSWYEAGDPRYQGNEGALGSETNPYLIQDGAEMKGLANLVNDTAIGYAKDDFAGKFLSFKENTLNTKVIDLINFSGIFYLDAQQRITFKRSSSAGTTDYIGWTPIGCDKNHPFKGTFRAEEGFEIRNLSVNASSYNSGIGYLYDAAGLFGYVDFSAGGSLEGIHLTEVQLAGTKSGLALGGLVGRLTGVNSGSANIVNCSVEGRQGEAYAPFAVAATTKIYVEGAGITPTNAQPDWNSVTGGLVGAVGSAVLQDDSALFEGCSVSGASVTASAGKIGGLIGSVTDNLSAKDCSFSGSVQLSGKPGSAWGIGGMTGSVPGTAKLSGCAVSGQIESLNGSAELACVGGMVGRAGALTADNCRMEGSLTLTSVQGSGGIAGTADKDTSITNCRVGDKNAPVVFTELSTTPNNKGVMYVGGILGTTAAIARIDRCDAYVSMEFPGAKIKTGNDSYAYVGGIAGKLGASASNDASKNGAISNCTAEGTIWAGMASGGIVGKTFGTVTDSSFFGSIWGNIRNNKHGIGGIAGDFFGTRLSGCTVQAEIEVPAVNMYSGAGGIAGRTADWNASTPASIVVENCLYNGRLAAGDQNYPNELGAGGIIGIARNTTVRQCFASAQLEWTSYKGDASIGGIVGRMENNATTISECASAGSISVTSMADFECFVGGLSGLTLGTVQDSYSVCTVQSDNLIHAVGGLSGGSTTGNKQLSNCYFAGAVLSSWGGSLVGSTYKGEIETSYYDRILSPNGLVSYDVKSYTKGSLLGDGAASDSYLAADQGAALSTGELTSGSLPQGFGAAWSASAGSYPRLAWMSAESASPALRGYSELTTIPALRFNSADDYTLYVNSAVVPSSPGGIYTSEWRDQGGALLPAGAYTLPENSLLTNAVSFRDGSVQWTLSRSFQLLCAPQGVPGNGRRATPFELATKEQLAVFASYVNAGGGYLGVFTVQTADIDLSGTAVTPIGTKARPFCGRMIAESGTAAYKKIKNLTLDRVPEGYTDPYGGLFGYCAYGVLDGVTLENAEVTTGAAFAGVGTLAGYAKNMYLFAASSAGASIAFADSDQPRAAYSGGLIGYADKNTTLSHSWFAGDVTNADSFGGLAGQFSGYQVTKAVQEYSTAEMSFAAGNFGDKNFTLEQSRDNVGGLFGATDLVKVSKSYFIGNLIGRNYTGGLVGNAGITQILSSYCVGDIDGNDRVGGLIGSGYTDSTGRVRTDISNSYFVGQITTSGLAGAISATVANLTNTYYNREITSSLKTCGSMEITGADKTTAELTQGGAMFSTGDFTQGTEADAHYPSLAAKAANGPGAGGASYKEGMRQAASVSTASLYDFHSNQYPHNNAYVVQNPFTTAHPAEVSILEPDNLASGFTVAEAGGVRTYTPSDSSEASLYPFHAVYSGLPYPNLTIRTKVIIVPFQKGNGTLESPFEIPDVKTLVAFRNYINQGSGAHGAYYRLTSPDAQPYDLAGIDWVPIGGVLPQSVLDDPGNHYYEKATTFNGHFDGNGRTIIGLRMGASDAPADYTGKDGLTAGFFGSIKSGSIRNFTLDDAQVYLNIDSNGFYAGVVAGVFDSSLATDQLLAGADSTAQTGVLVTNASLSVVSTHPAKAQQQDIALGGAFGLIKTAGDIQNCMADTALSYSETAPLPGDVKLGGIAGKADCDAGSILLDKVVARVQTTGPGTGGEAGGLIGQVVSPNAASDHVKISNSASYGSLSGYLEIGGAVGRSEGRQNPIANFTSTADLLVPQGGHAGGVYGYVEQINISNCVYGGLVQAETIDTKTYVGGLVGYFFFNGDQASSSKIDACTYDRSLNSGLTVETADQTKTNQFGLGFWKTNGWVDAKHYTALLTTLLSPDNAKHTFELTGGTAVIPTWEGAFLLTDGLYPYPAFTGADTTPDALENTVVANSVALYYVWAAGNPEGAAVKQRLSSSYVRYSEAGLSPSVVDGRIVVTSASKRLVSTRKEEERITARVQVAVNGTTALGKAFSFLPDNTPTGKPDVSFLVANPEGDGVHPDNTGDSPQGKSFTLYNADQLAGVSLLTALQGSGEGILLDDNFNYYSGNLSILNFSGINLYLGTDIDCGVYPAWTPVGPSPEKPFSGSFNGAHHRVTGLNLGGPQEYQGLFGCTQGSASSTVTLSNLGIAGQAVSSRTASYLGALLGYSGGNTTVLGCFSSVRVESTKAVGAVFAGGIAGSMANSTDLIEQSFFTGSVGVNTANSEAYAGGFVGDGGYLRITQSYAAGFSDASAGHYGSFAGCATSLRFTSSYQDVNACGQVNSVGTGSGAAVSIATSNLTASSDGAKPAQLTGFDAANWTFSAGLYPIQNGFALPGNSISVIPAVLEAHARSTTSGRLDYAGAAFSEGEGQAGKYILKDSHTFAKVDSGVTFIKLHYGDDIRLVYMDLKCWYEEEVDGVYTINNAYELQELAYLVNGQLDKLTHTHVGGNHQDSFENKTIHLAYDVDLSALEEFTPVGTAAFPFKGTFDGKGHTISGIQLSTDSLTEIGLFGATSGAVIQNTGLAGGLIQYTGSGAPLIGGIVGRAENTTISNCFNGTEISFGGSGAAVGGIAGSLLSGSLTGCFNMAAISYTGNDAASIGGIAGHNDAPISTSYNTGMLKASMSSTAFIGGISGGNTSTVQTCYNAALLQLEIGAASTIAPIAQGGDTPDCLYDRQFSDTVADAPQVTFVNSSELCTSGVFQTGWVQRDGHYPQLSAFAAGTQGQQAASLVSSEAALLKKTAGAATYKDFESVVMNAEGPLGGGVQQILVEKKQDGGSFDITVNGGKYTLLPADEGPTIMTVTIDLGGTLYQRDIQFLVIQMLNLRYQFDFSGIDSVPAEGRTTSVQTESTFLEGKGNGSAGSPYQVSTPDDLVRMSAAVADGSLPAGVYITLMAPIDLEGYAFTPIGTPQHPFSGTFDGNGYAIRNLVQTGGTTGLFGSIAAKGRVKRLALEDAIITLRAQGDQTGGILAAVNNGSITSCSVRGYFTVETPGSPSAQTRAGTLAGVNNGRITGCYFRPDKDGQISAVQSNISRSFESQTYFGILVGLNAGTMSGCYHTSDMATGYNCIDGNGIAGYSSTGSILNSVYDTFGDRVNYPVAFTGPDGDVLSETGYRMDTGELKTAQAALQLSFDLYLATFRISPGVNDGYPALDAFDLVTKQFPAFGDDHTILFNLQNNLIDSPVYTVMNAVCAYDGYTFPRFGKIPVNGSIVINLPDLPKNMGFQVEAVAYGSNEDGTPQTKQLYANNNEDYNRRQKEISTTVGTGGSMPDKAYQINVTIKLSGGEAQDPWGVRQKWNSAVMTGS